MQHRTLGRSGLRVSLVGLGCNNFGIRIDKAQTQRVIDAAVDHGITLFDTADIYGERGGSETLMGELMGDKRKKIVLATKFGMEMSDDGERVGGSRRWIMQAVEDSLRRLRTDWIDLYQHHRWDPATPVEETVRALDDLVRQGKVRYVGTSNYPSWMVATGQAAAKDIGATPFVSAQDEYSLLIRGAERELIPALKHYGMGLLPYFPLASGLLTGKYRRDVALPEGARLTRTQYLADRYFTEANWSKTEKLAAFCEKRGRTMVELAFSWLAMQSPVSSIIAGATSPEQIAANVKAAEWALSAGDLAELDAITAG